MSAYKETNFLLSFQLKSQQYEEQFSLLSSKETYVAAVDTLIDRAIILRKMDLPVLAFADFQVGSTWRRHLETPQLLKLFYQGCFSSFEAERLETTLELIEMTLVYANAVNDQIVIEELIKLKGTSEKNVSAPNYSRGFMRIPCERFPWDYLASLENLNSEEVLKRTSEQARIESNGCFEVASSAFGRGLFAAKVIRKNQKIAIKPSLTASYRLDSSKVCGHCCKDLPAHLMPFCCSKCPIRFCDSDCYENAMAGYHSLLCGKTPVLLHQLLSLSKATSSISMLSCLKVFAEAKFKGITPVEVSCVRDLCIGIPLFDAEQFQANGVINAFQSICKLLDIRLGDPQFQFWHFLAVNQRISSNSFQTGSIQGGGTNEILGFISMANHSCDRFNAQKSDSLNFLQRIKRGSELLISYVDPTSTGKPRRSQLNNLGIECACLQCSAA